MSQEIDVYPDILAVRRYDLLLRAHQLESHGFRRSRVRGAGTEFESLREYVPDDEYRRVDWKATARRGKPYTRQYQEERSRTIMLMIDAGRMMSAEIEGMSKLDYAINAALMVAYVAIRRDDAVGLIVFTDGAARNNQDPLLRRAGCGAYWGPGHRKNVAEPLPGRGLFGETNNVGELTAVIQVLEAEDRPLQIRTDLQWVIDGVERLGARRAAGWRRGATARCQPLY